MSKRTTLTYASEISDTTNLNSSFDKGVLKICYAGKNRNGSFIAKETIEKSVPSLFNCPVVCNYDRETDSLGGHDMGLVHSEDGSSKIVNLTAPVGVIPESADVWFEEFEEEDGTTHEYLCADVLLWKRQEAYEKIKRDGITAHSMEITVKSGKFVDGVYRIEDFEFNAFALIGVEPCFESSALTLFDFKKQMSDMMQDLKETIKSFGLNTTNTKGGNPNMSKKTENKKDFSLIENLLKEIRRELDKDIVPHEWGDAPRYDYIDLDTENNEVYALDTLDWLLYGFSFSLNGDAVLIDFESKKRKKFVIADFEGENAQNTSALPIFALMEEKIKSLNKSKAELEEKFSELGELRKFKADAEAEKAKKERDEVFSRFEDLNGIEAFEALKKDSGELAINEIEEKCFAIRGRNQEKLSFANKGTSPKLRVEKADLNPEPYGGLFIKYSKN